MTNRINILLVLTFILTSVCAQVNYVGNPSFENINCVSPNFIKKCYYWNSIDSTQIICGGAVHHTCFGNVPNAGPGLFQYPRSGNGYVRVTFLNPGGNGRTYPKNRLLTPLVSGKTYCVKMYINRQNCSPQAIDAFQVYLSDNTVDTITKCGVPLTYLNPQIQNPTGNIMNDSLNWAEVSGTFVANGTEKYLVIGNFKSDAATTTSVTGSCSGLWSEYNVDDVSVIDFNLSASAGPDKNINLGDSAFIGIPPEIGLECTWTSGSFTVGTGGGLWVKPTSPGTFSYVVTQNICGNIKTDTVNVNVSPSLISEHTMFSQSVGLFPQPANDIVKLIFRNYSDETVSIEILDTTGKTVYFKNEFIKNNSIVIPTDNLSDGIYYLKIKSSKDQFATKKLTVTH